MSFILGKHLVLLESFQFMSSGLDKLARNFPDETFKYTSDFLNDRRFKLVKQEGVHPCDYMDSLKHSMKNYRQKMNFTAFSKMSTYLMNNANMLKMCGRHLTTRQWVNTMICILNLTSFVN